MAAFYILLAAVTEEDSEEEEELDDGRADFGPLYRHMQAGKYANLEDAVKVRLQCAAQANFAIQLCACDLVWLDSCKHASTQTCKML